MIRWKIMKHLVIPSLPDLIKPGIFGIIDNRNIYIGYSKNMLKGISEQLSLIQDGAHSYYGGPIGGLQIVIIETLVDTPHLLKIRQTYWVDNYILQGYQVLNNKRLLRYHTRIRIDQQYQVLVELVSKNKNAIVVGVFNKVKEAEAYCSFLNLSNPIVPIVANNDLTLKYLKDNGIH